MRYLLLFIILSVSSCKPVTVYEKLVDLPGQQWSKKQNAVVIFDVNDSAAHQLYLIVRHTQQYPFNKMLVKLAVQDTAKHILSSMNISAPLTNSTGDWNGEKMDDILYNRIKIDPPLFLKPGTYRFVLQQQMKEDLVPHILNVGIAMDR
ncbi:MAG: gliding motility lipoprotein GldH [Niabella sp.]